MPTGSDQGSQLNNSEEHDNWLGVNEILPSIQEPLSIYVDETVQALHTKLRKDLLGVGKCSTPEDCNKKTKPSDLCKSCNSWFMKLAASHEKGNNLSWHKNCTSAKWPEDHWEVAKFFMPALGSNLSTVNDAESTDISSLLNVLEWMNNGAFLSKTRIDVNLAKKLRSEVRNSSAHNPQQKIQDKKTKEDFTTAIEFIKELERVWPGHAETQKCLENLENLRDIGVTNIFKGIKTRLPDELKNFIGRDTEIEEVITFLMKDEKAVVSLHGGPGFGKTAIATEVSHRLNKIYDITVVFSYFSTVTSVDGMIRKLCGDVGVNYEDKDPKSTLNLRLKHIKSKVIFVMDNIDYLLDDRPPFDEFVRDLRATSKHCQIVTTSRMSYEIPDITVDVEVKEMSMEECKTLLRGKCPEQNDEFLQLIAEGCGNVPLAMCIAGDRVQDFENPYEVLQHLQTEPLKLLERYDTKQFVKTAIKMSYEKCSDEEKETLVRLSVFNGSFSEKAARAVNEKDILTTTNILMKLFCRSLIKQPTKHRYSFHLLIKHFLVEQQNGEDETAGRAKAQFKRAQRMMVNHYLELEHDLTMKSYSKDGYQLNREALKEKAHNILNVLKLCCQQSDPTTSDISHCLTNSKVYTTSARHFSLLVRTIIPGSIVNEFIQRCADMAKNKQQHAIKLNFDLLLADQERIKSINKPDTLDYDATMENIQKEFDTHAEDIKKNKSLCANYHYQCGRYITRKSLPHQSGEGRKNLQNKAREQLKLSLKLRREQQKQLAVFDISVDIADTVHSLLEVGNTYKIFDDKNAEIAERYFNEAITLSQEKLGKHELTAHCHKYLGDLFLTNDKFEQAEREYIVVKQMREILGLDTTERYVFLLKNLGICLIKNGKINEALENLERARYIAEKLLDPESPKAKHCTAKVYASLAIAYDLKGENSEAVKYANKAMKIKDVLHNNEVEKIQEILSKETK